MYEINTHNLKLYLLASSIIFFLTNGLPLPLLTMFNNGEYNQNENIKGDNFIIVNKNNNNNNYNDNYNYYDVNATIVKHTFMFNTDTEYFTGSIMLQYKNYVDTHKFCKIDVEIKEQKRNDIIYEFIYKYYNLSRNNIKLNCNNIRCIHNLTTYEDTYIDTYQDTYQDAYQNDNNIIYKQITCNILSIKQLNDEF